MEKEVRLRVAGLKDSEQAQRVEADLHSKAGVHEVEADADSGTLRLKYDTVRVPPPRLQAYLKDVGLKLLKEG